MWNVAFAWFSKFYLIGKGSFQWDLNSLGFWSYFTAFLVIFGRVSSSFSVFLTIFFSIFRAFSQFFSIDCSAVLCVRETRNNKKNAFYLAQIIFHGVRCFFFGSHLRIFWHIQYKYSRYKVNALEVIKSTHRFSCNAPNNSHAMRDTHQQFGKKLHQFVIVW